MRRYPREVEKNTSARDAVIALPPYSQVHATVAGVLPAFAVPVVRSLRADGPEAGPGLAEPAA